MLPVHFLVDRHTVIMKNIVIFVTPCVLQFCVFISKAMDFVLYVLSFRVLKVK